MRLSIITISRNNAEGLKRTLDSVKAQTCQEFEHIIIDGASSDDSVKIIESYVRDVSCMKYDVLWVSEPDTGIYNAMNKGIEIALGRSIVNSFNRSELVEDKNKVLPDYVFILNSGDALASPDVIQRMMEALALNDGMPILLGNIVHVYGDGKKVREKIRKKTNDLILQPIEASMLTFYTGTIPHDSAFVRRDLFEKYGYFDEDMKICADWKLYLDMIALGGVVPMYVDIDVVNFDMSGVSNTHNEQRMAERRAYLEKVLPAAVLKDYNAYAVPISQYNRIRKHHLWGIVRFMERVLFKLEKWHVLR